MDGWTLILITKISIIISILLPEHSLKSDLLNWFFYTLHKFVKFPPLSDIELYVTL